MKELFFGALFSSIYDAERYLPTPKAPRNYKDSKAIADFIERARDAMLEQAAMSPVTGTLQAVTVLDETGRIRFAATGGQEGVVSRQLAGFLVSQDLDDYPDEPNRTFTPTTRLWGFGVKTILRVMALEVLRESKAVPMRLPLRLWYNHPAAYDPYTMLFGGEDKPVSYFGLCQYLGIPINAADLNDAEGLAQTVRQLVIRAQLTSSLLTSTDPLTDGKESHGSTVTRRVRPCGP